MNDDLHDYQRVHLGALYGFIRIIDGEPERTYCCSLTPSVWRTATTP